MCGIIGYTGDRNFLTIAKQGLLNLEYRGYDSAGVAFFDKGKIHTIKQKGDVSTLFEKIDGNLNTKCGIGHTRWATHGIPNDVNSHPHSSSKKLFTVVHNGMIENYKELKDKYLSNITFASNTDTEVIPNLIEYYFHQSKDVLKSIQQTIKMLQGSFALAILFVNEPTKIYFARSKSPLVIGIGKTEKFISSDLIGMGDECEKYTIINNFSYGYITNKTIKTYNYDGKPTKVEIKKKQKTIFQIGKGKYPHYMLKEINDIPLGLEATAKLYENKHNILSQIPKSYFEDIKEIVIIACGTSYHSALIGEKYIKELGNIRCSSKVASEFIYGKEIVDKSSLCLFISQSGETADTLTAINKAKTMGAKTIGITNVPTSSITTICDYILPICAGSEVAVASTKAYNCQLAILYVFASYLKNNYFVDKKCINNIIKLSKHIHIEALRTSIDCLTDKLRKSKNIYMIGRDYDYITCMEACLKLKEISYIPCEAYPAGELKHGTLALITKGVPVIAIITEKELVEKTMMIVEQVKARGGNIFIFTSCDLSNYNTKNCVVVNIQQEERMIMPIYSIIPFQILSYCLTISLGYNPDRPRNLAKSVTVE